MELKGNARLVDGWDDLNKPEYRTYILRCLTYAGETEEELEDAKITIDNQNKYIEQLEKQMRLLQKTLDVVYKNNMIAEKTKTEQNDFVTGERREDCQSD